LAIGIVDNKQIVYAKGFGFKNIETKEPMSITTLFHIASISKPFVATAVMQLLNQNKIQLDAPVITYLPYFKLDDKRYKNITIQQILSHTSDMLTQQTYKILLLLFIIPVNLFAQYQTVHFQRGVDGYNGTVDTYINKTNPDSYYGTGTGILWDGSPAELTALIREFL
jgi:hypothetical protein